MKTMPSFPSTDETVATNPESSLHPICLSLKILIRRGELTKFH
jgi:hypothetical protein